MRRWVLGLLACVALVGVGCSSGADTETPRATEMPPGSATPTASARPPSALPIDSPPLGFLPEGAATGISGVDSLVADLYAGSVPSVLARIRLTEFTCAQDSNIVCVGDESEGSRVEAFVIGECAGGGALRSVSEVAVALESVLSQPGYLRGVTSFSEGWTVPEGYEVLWGTQLDSRWNLTLIVDGSGLVLGADAGCGFDPIGDWVLPPPGLTQTQELSKEIETVWIKLATLAEQITSESCRSDCAAGTGDTFDRYCASIVDSAFEQRPGYDSGRHDGWTMALRGFCNSVQALDDRGDLAKYKVGVDRALSELSAEAGSRPVEFPPLPAFLP